MNLRIILPQGLQLGLTSGSEPHNLALPDTLPDNSGWHDLVLRLGTCIGRQQFGRAWFDRFRVDVP